MLGPPESCAVAAISNSAFVAGQLTGCAAFTLSLLREEARRLEPRAATPGAEETPEERVALQGRCKPLEGCTLRSCWRERQRSDRGQCKVAGQRKHVRKPVLLC